ncbi:MAG: hypothetical protein RLZZ142_2406 [Verrucomicrobiota bacterium]
MRIRTTLVWCALLCGAFHFPSASLAAEWAAYRGPSQNGISSETAWKVPASAAREVWKAQVGIGTSSMTVSGGRLFTMGHLEGKDVVQCVEAETGREVWRYALAVSLDPNLFEGGPRSTPTVAGGVVYTLSHEGHLLCLKAADGKLLWQKHLVKDFGGKKPEWGYSGSPTVSGDAVYVDCGGEGASTLALNRHTGEVIWKSGSHGAGYATPLIVGAGAQRSLVLFKADALVGCDLQTGRELWRFPWKTSYDINAATPLVVGEGRFLITSGYNTGAAVVAVDSGEARQVWRANVLRAHINSPVWVNGAVFGIDGNTGGGNLVCVDPATGQKRWEERSVKGGALISAAGKLIVVSEKGDLVIAEANPEGFRPLHRQLVLTRRTWAQPTLSEGLLYLRDNQGQLVCLDLR